MAESFLARLRLSNEATTAVAALVRHHLAPSQLPQGGATPKAYRRLARRLEAAGINAQILYRVAQADHFGRTTPDALARSFPAGEEFLCRVGELAIAEKATSDVVLGRHLIARGLTPSPRLGEILAACREVQDETGWEEPERVLERVMAEMDGG